MTINLKMPDITELKPRITVFGVGGAGGNAVNNMITAGLQGVEFVVANTDAQALSTSQAERVVQMGIAVTEGLGAGSQPEIGRAAAEEVIDEINDHLAGSHMVFITAGMGGGTGTGAAPVIARAAREHGILTVGVVTKPFHFEGQRRMRIAESGIDELQKNVDTLICIPNQNLFRIANEKTTFADAFSMADEVLYSGVACITDLMVKEGLINLDFADVRSIMREMGKAMMGTGEASGDRRAVQAAEAAIANPLLDDISMQGARGLLISITGGQDLTLFEVDEAATRIREEVDPEANIILGATFDEGLEGVIRVSVVATGIDQEILEEVTPAEIRLSELAQQRETLTVEQHEEVAEEEHAEEVELPQFIIRDDVQEQVSADLMQYEEMEAAPVASAEDPDVMIEPFRPEMPAFSEPEPQPEIDPMPAPEVAEQPAPQRHFIPPQAEMPEPRAPRMPRMEEFPPVGQREFQARMAPEAPQETAPEAEEKGPMTILRRLANVGLGRKEHEAAEAEPAPAPTQQVRPQMPATAQMAPPQAYAPQQAPRSEFAKPRPAPQGMYQPQQGQLDPRGRAQPQPQAHEDEQLEIPAFLRRQAN
ncbi:cell division protein FtsZ [Coralliovum pocilloporae]|uniref:cell division protein FtsZ n=1 Tax=Coralliovum pocilloporae TaxID=3066369 RepID=UPI003306EB6A